MLDAPVLVGERDLALDAALGRVVAVDDAHAHAAERVLRALGDAARQPRLGDAERLEREPAAGPQHGAHPGERARAVLRRQVAEAVAPADDGVERARHRQRAQVAGEEARVDARRRRGGGRVLDLGGRDVDAGHAMAGAGERERDPPVAARDVEDRRARRQVERAQHAREIGVEHRRAGGAPEAGGEALVEADEPVVGDGNGVRRQREPPDRWGGPRRAARSAETDGRAERRARRLSRRRGGGCAAGAAEASSATVPARSARRPAR